MCNQTLLLKGQYLYFDLAISDNSSFLWNHFSSSAINWFLTDIYRLFKFYNYWLFRAILKLHLSLKPYQFCILSNYIIVVNIYYITWSVSIQHQYTFKSVVFSPVNYLGRWECLKVLDGGNLTSLLNRSWNVNIDDNSKCHLLN